MSLRKAGVIAWISQCQKDGMLPIKVTVVNLFDALCGRRETGLMTCLIRQSHPLTSTMLRHVFFGWLLPVFFLVKKGNELWWVIVS